MIEVKPGHDSTEFRMHYYEEECVYILQGEAKPLIDSSIARVAAGDFIGIVPVEKPTN